MREAAVRREVAWVRIVEPTEALLSLAEAKAHLRVEGSDEDALIAGYVAAAAQWCEEFTSRAFVTQTWEMQLPSWPRGREIRLPRPPLASVEWVRWLDDEDIERTMNPDFYFVDTVAEPGRIELETGANWPDGTMQVRGVTVRFTAGYGGGADVPAAVRQAARFLVGHSYENRESVVVGAYNGSHVPDTARALLWPWRVW